MNPNQKLKLLKRHKMSRAEWAIMATIGMWPFPRDDLARTAASHSEGDPLGHVSAEACEAALFSCISKGWLRIVDERILQCIRSFLQRRPSLGPIYGLPEVGDVDFTTRGANNFRKIIKELFGANWNADAIYKKEKDRGEDLFVRTKRAALKAIGGSCK
jgi:hypothetical protein